jgi:hypothetical protein
MTADIINLRKARKDKARAEKEKRASENRARFGRPKHEREEADANEALRLSRLDRHRREPDPTDG